MKAVACLVGLCLLAGLVTAEYAWETGKQYKYQVRGRVMAGIAEINTQYAGLELHYVQLITVTAPNVLNVKTEELKAIETNEELQEGGWRDGQIRKGQEAQIPEELRHYLTAPMDMILEKGVVGSIKVPSDLPTWAVNIKKAMASTFNLDTTGAGSEKLIVEGNLNRPSAAHNSVRGNPSDSNQESGFFYETLEQSVHGECEVYYTVSQNGPFDYPYQFEAQAQAGVRNVEESSEESSTEFMGKRQHQNRVYKAYKAAAKASSSSSSSESSEESSKERSWPRAFNQLCEQNDQVYEIIKTVNFTACTQKPVLAYSTPAELNFRPADNAGGSLWGRALVSRYIACGQSRQNYTILKITQQERFFNGLRDTEKIVAGAQKNITLLSIGHGQATPVQSPKTINNLVYTFDPKQQQLIKEGRLQTASQMTAEARSESAESREASQEYQQDAAYVNQRGQYKSTRQQQKRQQQQYQQQYQQAYQTQAEGKTQLPKPDLEHAPLAAMFISPLKQQEMKSRINKLMQEIAQDLTKSTEKDSIAEREVLSKISTVVKILRVLDSQDIQESAQKWTQSGNEEQEVARSIFIDALAIAGTNPAVVYLLKQIKSGQLNGEEAAQVLATLPMYIRTPTRELLEKYFEVMEDEAVKRQEQVRTTAMLSFSTLLANACINKKVKNTRYPVALYGEFCSETYVAKKFVPYFVQKLEKRLESNTQQDQHWIVTLLAVLGNLGHPDTIEIVQKIMDEQTNHFIKTKAIFALKNLVKSRSNLNQQFQQQSRKNNVLPVDRQSRDIVTDEVIEHQVLPVLVSVAFDRGEHPQVRNAAISLLLHCTYADVAIWQQLAMATWFEQSRDVRTFVYSSLKSLAELDHPIKGVQVSMQHKARAVLPLAKPIKASIARSHNLFTAHFVEPINSGFAQQLSYFQGSDSILPTNMYYRNYFNFGNGAAGVHPVEFSVAGNTIQKLANAFYHAVTKTQGQQENLEKHQDMSVIKNLLNIESRKQDEPVQGAIYLRLRDEIERMWTFDDQTIEQLAQQLIQNANSKGELNVNYQKAVHMAEHLASMPTIMGFPLDYSMQMPALISIRGIIKMQQQQGEQGYTLQADLAPVYAWKIHRKLSFKVPFTGKSYQTGVQRHIVVEAPFSAVARKAPQGQIQLALTPAHLSAGAPTGTINLVTYHQIPYTAIISDEFYPINHQQGGKMQIVHANQDPKDNYERREQFGEKSLGLVFQLNEKSEFPEQQETLSGWSKFIRKFHTVNCAFNAAWLGSPSIRFVKREFILDLDKSQTKTLVLLLAARRQRTSVARQLASSEESVHEQRVKSQQQKQQQQQQFGRQSGSFESTSSSESQEGQNWFKYAQTPKQNQQQQRRQQKQQRGSQSASFESASFEYQSRESSESQEQQRQQSRLQGHVLVVALLGKKQPLESLNELKSQVQKPLLKSSPSTVQFLFQLNANQGKLFTRVAVGDAVNQAAEVLPQSSRAFQAIREAIVKSSNEKNQPKYCAELKLTVDTPKYASRHIVAVRRETLLAQDLAVKVQGQLQAGASCRVMPLQVTVQGKLRRDAEMTEWAQHKSPEAKQCNQDKKKGFSVSQVCMDVSEQQAAALNNIQLTFQHTPMPKQVQNVTVYHIQNFLKAALYPYMSENQFPEHTGVQHNQFQIRARITPNKQFINFEIRKPDSILSFNNIKTGRVLKTLLPLTATQTPYGNIKDRLFRSQSDSMCAIEKNYVNTFDNVTYSFNKQAARGCEHVLAQDCSGKYPMSVLVKNLQQNQGRAVTILLGAQTKIQVIPQGGAAPGRLAGIRSAIFGSKSESSESQSQESAQGYSTKSGSRMTVLVNNQVVTLPAVVPAPQREIQQQQQRGQNIKNVKPIAEIVEMPNGGVQVVARRIQVATDGARVIVYASNEFRNRTCGLCGDFNNEKVAELRSPKDFPLSSGSLLVASYAFPQTHNNNQQQEQQQQQQGECQIDQQIQRLVRKEEQAGEQQDRHIPNIYQRGQQYASKQEQRRQQQREARKQEQEYLKEQRQHQRRFNPFRNSQEKSSSSESFESKEEQQWRHQAQQQAQQQTQQQKLKFSWFGRRGQSNKNQEQSQESTSEERKEQPLSMTFVQKMVENNQGKHCTTVNRIHVCAPGFMPQSEQKKTVTVVCTSNEKRAREMKEQIQAGQYVQLNHKQNKEQMPIRVPRKCIKA
jgi:hypothetical protein